MPIAFWLVAYITSLGDRKQTVLERVERYVTSPKISKESPSFHVSTLVQDPLLKAALKETLRLQVLGLSVRGLQEDTTVTIEGRPYTLEKHSSAIVAMPLIHKDPNIYENPDNFELERFLENKEDEPKVFWKNGVPLRTPLIPWGGGLFKVSWKHASSLPVFGS
jgi:cytochrome P450